MTDHISSCSDVHSNVRVAEALDELIYFPYFRVTAFIQSVKKNSDFEGLGTFYEKIDSRFRSGPYAAFDILIDNFEIWPVFIGRRRQLLETTCGNIICGLCFPLFLEEDINGFGVGTFQILDRTISGSLDKL